MSNRKQNQLMPSVELREELYALAHANSRIAELTHRQPDDPDPNHTVKRFASQDGDRIIYPLVEIPTPRSGELYVGRMPGYSSLPVERELEAIATFGFAPIVCLVPEADVIDLYELPTSVPAAREPFGDRFHLSPLWR